MKYIHRFFSKFNLSLGGHKACLKYGCKHYCGYSPTEALLFSEKKE